MLWYKAWLETRWRALMPLGMLIFVFFTAHDKGQLQLAQGKASLLTPLPVFWLLAPLTLAGSGIRTEAPFRIVKGLEGSRIFTLSLPVSRLQLLMSRVVFGIVETAGIVAAICCVAAVAFPEVRAQINPADGIRYALTVLLCSSAVYGLSTLASTFLDQQWQVLGTMISVFALRWLSDSGGLPRSLDIFRAMGLGSPLLTHTVPWPAIAFSLSVTAICLATAAAVIQRREY